MESVIKKDTIMSCKHCGEPLGNNELEMKHASECPVMCGDFSPEESSEYGHPEGDPISTKEINREVDKILFSPFERFIMSIKEFISKL